MKNILLYDTTLKEIETDSNISFRDKLDLIKVLDELSIYAIQMPAPDSIYNKMLVSSIAPHVKNSNLVVDVNLDKQSIDNAISALNGIENSFINICIPTSSILMEYKINMKEKNLPALVDKIITYAKTKNTRIQISLQDLARANNELIDKLISIINEHKISNICIEESIGKLEIDQFKNFINSISEKLKTNSKSTLIIKCSNNFGFSLTNSLLSLKNNFSGLVTCLCGKGSTDCFGFLNAINEIETLQLNSNVKLEDVKMIAKKISWLHKSYSLNDNTNTAPDIKINSEDIINTLNQNSDKETVITAIKNLGFNIDHVDNNKLFNEYQRIAQKKEITAKEIDAIVATSADDVPATYKLVDFVINTSNLFPSMAYVTIDINGIKTSGQSYGPGPINAAILAIEKIVQTHYELEDFQLQNLTKSSDSVGVAIFKLRNKGHIYSGKAVSIDIVSATIRAYLNALNQLVYAEKQ